MGPLRTLLLFHQTRKQLPTLKIETNTLLNYYLNIKLLLFFFPLVCWSYLHHWTSRLVRCGFAVLVFFRSNFTTPLMSFLIVCHGVLFQYPPTPFFTCILTLSLSVKRHTYAQAQNGAWEHRCAGLFWNLSLPSVISHIGHAATCTAHLIVSSLAEIIPGN